MVWSAGALELDWCSLDYCAFGTIFLLLPLSMTLNAYELILCVKASGGVISFRRALGYSSTATIANVLPVPASTMIRGAAVVESGASIAESGKIIVAAGLLWLAMASAITALAIFPGIIGLLFCFGGLSVCAALIVWITLKSDFLISIQFVVVRAVMIGLLMLRLFMCFMTINAGIRLIDTAVFSVVGIVGNVAAIVPAGIGVTESLGALLAPASGTVAAAAFLALALNRLTGLAGAGLISLLLFSGKPAHTLVGNV